VTVTDSISVISDVLIQGTVALSGGGTTRIFVVSGSSGALRLSDVTLENGRDASGGAILQNVNTLLVCTGSSFKNNKAENFGGAISSSGTLDIDGCSFESNEAGNEGEAIYKDSGFPLTINGTALAQFNLIRRTRRLVATAGAPRAKVTAVASLVSAAHANYLGMWSTIWSYQSVFQICPSSRLTCSTIATSQNDQQFKAGSQSMTSLLNNAVRQLRSVSRRGASGKKLIRQMAKLHRKNLVLAGKIPGLRSEC
jgi:predicted outer membrane repeat protein